MSDFKKFDKGKRLWRAVPFEVIDVIAGVFHHGALKYGSKNYQKCEDWDRYFDAMMRHIVSWRNGEKIDPDSGLPTLAHVICNAWMLLWHEQKELKKDV